MKSALTSCEKVVSITQLLWSISIAVTCMTVPDCRIPYSGKLLREKTLANFKVLWLFMKDFSIKFGGVVSFGSTSEQSTSLLCENRIFHQFAKVFFLESSPLYGRHIGATSFIARCLYLRPSPVFAWHEESQG